jgi:hypothetical protein
MLYAHLGRGAGCRTAGQTVSRPGQSRAARPPSPCWAAWYRWRMLLCRACAVPPWLEQQGHAGQRAWAWGGVVSIAVRCAQPMPRVRTGMPSHTCGLVLHSSGDHRDRHAPPVDGHARLRVDAAQRQPALAHRSRRRACWHQAASIIQSHTVGARGGALTRSLKHGGCLAGRPRDAGPIRRVQGAAVLEAQALPGQDQGARRPGWRAPRSYARTRAPPTGCRPRGALRRPSCGPTCWRSSTAAPTPRRRACSGPRTPARSRRTRGEAMRTRRSGRRRRRPARRARACGGPPWTRWSRTTCLRAGLNAPCRC